MVLKAVPRPQLLWFGTTFLQPLEEKRVTGGGKGESHNAAPWWVAPRGIFPLDPPPGIPLVEKPCKSLRSAVQSVYAAEWSSRWLGEICHLTLKVVSANFESNLPSKISLQKRKEHTSSTGRNVLDQMASYCVPFLLSRTALECVFHVLHKCDASPGVGQSTARMLLPFFCCLCRPGLPHHLLFLTISWDWALAY